MLESFMSRFTLSTVLFFGSLVTGLCIRLLFGYMCFRQQVQLTPRQRVHLTVDETLDLVYADPVTHVIITNPDGVCGLGLAMMDA